jgi:hypothetical protein
MARKAGTKKRCYRRNSISLNEVVSISDGGTSQLSELLDSSAGRRHTGQRARKSLLSES